MAELVSDLGVVPSATAHACIAADGAVYEAVQRRIESSSQPGVIGTREERIGHFHQYVARIHEEAPTDARRPNQAG